MHISNHIIWICSYDCPRNRAILAAILAISTFCPLCSQSIPQYLYLGSFINGLLVTLFLHCRTALGKMSLFTWRPLCSHITLVAAIHLWSCELIVNAHLQINIWTYTNQMHICDSICYYNECCDPDNLWWYVPIEPNLLIWPYDFWALMAIQVYALYNNSRVILALLIAFMLGTITFNIVWLSQFTLLHCWP